MDLARDVAADGERQVKEIADHLQSDLNIGERITAVSDELYGKSNRKVGVKRVKDTWYGDAGPKVLLDIRCRYEDWKRRIEEKRKSSSPLLSPASLEDRLVATMEAMSAVDPEFYRPAIEGIRAVIRAGRGGVCRDESQVRPSGEPVRSANVGGRG